MGKKIGYATTKEARDLAVVYSARQDDPEKRLELCRSAMSGRNRAIMPMLVFRLLSAAGKSLGEKWLNDCLKEIEK